MKFKIKNKKIKIISLILLFILLGIIVSFSSAKYQTKITGKSYTKIAKPITEIIGQESISITGIKPKAIYQFEVRNYNGNNEINEANMEYYIEIVPMLEEIKLNLYKDNKEILLKNNKTELINLLKNNKETNKYTLEVEYIKEASKSKEDINENIEIKLHSIQKNIKG